MRALVQRVSRASVRSDGAVLGEIGGGLLILVCAMEGDGPQAPEKMAAKIAKMRIFKDEAGKMNHALLDTGGSALVVSQFTLAGDTSRGNRPGFSSAARPEISAPAYEAFCSALRAQGVPVETGRFGADMQVELINDGPVTLWVDL
ncbi:D-tyrosyl-tRNA(Tyr) deacylase [Litorivita pollutaquae]|uniref:D-aminoacyl-tRNA deacylase n=1 Tax=Litorivita pollutaquae TaxID=2200892 RepID=A0A2V4MTT7_9RHOB|nr:D-aminoacyl-tRNA deacylase [Litorivita pollutaquae]PYC48929.1 D-tyrosyl-tRNA(Tyr) deacylase [Litorivita pollutaquae]